MCSSSTTYSGGQAFQGQGGYYGALKSRSEPEGEKAEGAHASSEDLTTLQSIMSEMKEMEELKMEVYVKEHDVDELCKRLHIRGGPVWGLSQPERVFVTKWYTP